MPCLHRKPQPSLPPPKSRSPQPPNLSKRVPWRLSMRHQIIVLNISRLPTFRYPPRFEPIGETLTCSKRPSRRQDSCIRSSSDDTRIPMNSSQDTTVSKPRKTWDGRLFLPVF